MKPAVGSLVQARGREWVVLPDLSDEPDVLMLRPLTGSDDEVTGIYTPLEPVEPARFAAPDPDSGLGNHRSCALLRDAIRLGFRSSAGPFRSLGRIAVEPRPYQLVPLLMALRQDPVRLLIADDVGIGKTIEACLIARELVDRGEVRRLTVLCPPHLADQWQRALVEQFHLDARTVLPGTAARLEREAGLSPHDSLFEHYPYTVVSLDYIKSDKHRDEFLRTCPELVIVDEAHGCASAGLGRAAHQRHALVADLAKERSRHLVLVTATPHSGNEQSFRELLALLDPSFAELPADLSGEHNRAHRERLAEHMIQRRRGDIRAYLDTTTPFPERELREQHYELSSAYRELFNEVLAYCQESVRVPGLDQRRQRVRWWSALALLRSLGSSPAAAAATLRTRAASADTSTVEEADDVGSRTVLDRDDESAEGHDVAPGTQEDPEGAETPEKKRLLALAKKVDQLGGGKDHKLQRALDLVGELLAEGWKPILFCRFIPTVDYVTAALRKRFPNAVIEGVTGLVGHEERERRVDTLGKVTDKPRVMVCTDCLSEGINLQHFFNAVLHYDLSWNPTRHEQREGRVDRYGQDSKIVRTLTYYGKDNPVDGIVLDVLLRKHRAIRTQLGISVPVPMDTGAVMEAVFESLLLRGKKATIEQLSFEFLKPHRHEVESNWDRAAEREKQSRTVFAQRTIRVEEVAEELREIRHAIGDAAAVAGFVGEALTGVGAQLAKGKVLGIDLTGVAAAVRDAVAPDGTSHLETVFEEPVPSGALLLGRTHPVVTGLAEYVWNAALDGKGVGPARRCATIRTDAVTRRTTVLLLRLRFHLVGEAAAAMLAEEAVVTGFVGSPEVPEWLDSAAAEKLLEAQPGANTAPELGKERVNEVVAALPALRPALEKLAAERAARLLEAHRRVRRATRAAVRGLRVEPHLPVDLLGIFVYLPVDGGAL